ncbi:hypothetical protein J4E05_23995 [Thalassospira sp. NFXS8]|uniref:hypothetical protein n=1 Tax=Thalassospira sp. NFXS8 TaxID=2819093 RepID=UPI0032DF262F
MSDTPKIRPVETANAHLSESDYFKLATEAVNRAGEDGPLHVDPDVADDMGAFRETALSDQDALDSHFDGLEPTGDDDPAGSNVQ